MATGADVSDYRVGGTDLSFLGQMGVEADVEVSLGVGEGEGSGVVDVVIGDSLVQQVDGVGHQLLCAVLQGEGVLESGVGQHPRILRLKSLKI